MEDIKELNQEEIEELINIGRLGKRYLKKYCHPHTRIEMDEDGIYLNENLCFIPWDNIKLDDKDEFYQ